MPHKTEKMTHPDPIEKIEQLWPHLHAWQRTILLTRALFYAAVGYKRKQAHWIKAPAHWL